ncbi:MAG: flagellar hook protein FlgE [Candidatus Eisenbacteria bacterium]|uniref:Flagellar hook protein FlgE n=1 Tax=Eiseniibacteriota bacterium TaxID=2212470 RepID=A0A849SP76_UNCEI|nr:flagellar hook protein FlgE [Candidatus Eisenbacteria bacterium]
MMRALFAGVSGLRNHQIRMDVIGNNIANVNTVAFKSSRASFKESFVQTLQGASRPSATLGGTNPMQIGTGVNLGSVDQIFTQGSLEATGSPFDFGIQGDSMFVLHNGQRRVYSRAGNFKLDADGRMVLGNTGFLLQGINADSLGNFSTGSAVGDIQLRLSDRAAAQPTSALTLAGNLDAGAAVGATHTMTVTTYDSAGASHEVSITFTKTAAATWDWAAACPTATVAPAGTGTVSFASNGSLAGFTYPGGGAGLTLTPTTGGAPFNMTINAGTVGGIDGLAGFANPSNAVVSGQNGYPSGELLDITVDQFGVISGFFSNGVTRSLAQIALGSFTNPSGLTRAGDNAFEESSNSGIAIVGFAGVTNDSTITAGALEGSNVDISQEFTNMIVTQRGFQANARVITTADELLNELVNLRR